MIETAPCNDCILVVDDAQIARDIEHTFLANAGYKVLEAVDGNEAVEMFVRYNPALVIMDIIMPHVDGILALRRIKRINPGAKVLICTAADDYRMINLALKEGAVGYIIKPYKGIEFIKKVHKILTEES